jgi:hypothetical protein
MEEFSERERSLNLQPAIDTNDQQLPINIVRFTLEFQFAGSGVGSRVRRPQVPPQTHEQCNRHAHHDQRTDTQDKEPPDHPHDGVG